MRESQHKVSHNSTAKNSNYTLFRDNLRYFFCRRVPSRINGAGAPNRHFSTPIKYKFSYYPPLRNFFHIEAAPVIGGAIRVIARICYV